MTWLSAKAAAHDVYVEAWSSKAGRGAWIHVERCRIAVFESAAERPGGVESDAGLCVGTADQLARCAVEPGTVALALPCLHEVLASTFELLVAAARDRNRARLATRLVDVGLALNTERDPAALLARILTEARAVAGADAGSIYVVEQGGRALRFRWAQNASVDADLAEFTLSVSESSVVGACVVTGQSINLCDMYSETGSVDRGRRFVHDRSFDERFGYQTRSVLSVPMHRPGGEVLGVIQLINAKRGDGPLKTAADFDRRVRPFDDEVVRVCTALAAQAAVALENASLYAEISTMFEGFVRASVVAIEQRDPTTSGHSQRVADLTTALARVVDRSDEFAGVHFDAGALREIEYAALLHDFGKVGVREEVLVKAKKLAPLQVALIGERFAHVRTALRLGHARKRVDFAAAAHGQQARWDDELAAALAQVDKWWQAVRTANEPSVLHEDCSHVLHGLADVTFDLGDGPARRLLEDAELAALLVQKGSLTPDERVEIQNHVRHTYAFLSRIPWGSDLARVPEIAAKHHEYLDGSGYPERIGAGEIPVQARMMTVADIFDALTASDRPYKRAVPVARALDILGDEARRGKVDARLLQLFVEARVCEAIGLTASS